MASRSSSSDRQFGDFQTPAQLAERLCSILRDLGSEPELIIEPTCGRGSLLIAAALAFPRARGLGLELNGEHVTSARAALRESGLQSRVEVIEGDFFGEALLELLPEDDQELLVVGNPPWITSAEMARIGGHNLPKKRNLKGQRGIDAISGASNFDISESVIVTLLEALQGRRATIAMICKRTVSRRVLEYGEKKNLALRSKGLWLIDARRHFGAAVEAGFHVFRTDEGGGDASCSQHHRCPQFDFDGRPAEAFGVVDGVLVASLEPYERWQPLVGKDELVWRSGVKHDCAKVMTLIAAGEQSYRNGYGDEVPLEADYLLPLYRGTDLRKGTVHGTQRVVILPQRRVGEPTEPIETRAPLTWRYLMRHRDVLDRRASTIYSGKPPFSIFGIGPYSFLPWKVAISGLTSSFQFRLIGPHHGLPAMLDDTCYFIGFKAEETARIVVDLLDLQPARELLESLTFWDAKRPVTKAVLESLHLGRLARWAREHNAMPSVNDSRLRSIEDLAGE